MECATKIGIVGTGFIARGFIMSLERQQDMLVSESERVYASLYLEIVGCLEAHRTGERTRDSSGGDRTMAKQG
jgi:hypothetical protein